MSNTVEEIARRAKLCGEDVLEVCDGILQDERFAVWSGSSQPCQHHYGHGGLAQHILEVIETCFRVKSLYEHKYEFDSKEIFLAAFFHDVGKLYDYKQVEILDPTDPAWTGTEHKRMIHHISRSGIMWAENCKRNKDIEEWYFEKVLHAILSHHLHREHGSPVAPKTRTAWLLTLCDNISARMADCETLDVLNRRR